MTISKVCTNKAANSGAGGCSKVNPFVDVVKRLALIPGFSFATVASFTTEADVTTAIRAKNLIPLPDIWDVEDTSVATNYATSSNENMKKTRGLKKRFSDKYDVPLDVHQALKTMDQINYSIITIDGANNVKFYQDGDLVKGFTTSTFSVEDQMDASQDGGTPALTNVMMAFKNNDEWDVYGNFVNIPWASALQPLTSVYVEQVGTASATAVTLRVYANGGYNADGTVNKIGIAGLVAADFTATTTAGADQSSALGTVTDNGDGTYLFASTALATGTTNLVTTPNLSDTEALYDSHFGLTDGEAALTIT